MASSLGIIYTVAILLVYLPFAASLEKVYFGNKIVTTESSGATTFETVTDISVKGCIDNCKRRKKCGFVNYYNGVRVCYLIHQAITTVQASTEQGVGFLYWKKSELSMTGYEVCGICEEHETCTITNGQAHCDVTSCSPPASKPNMVVSGNMYTVGSRLLLSCANDTGLVGRTSGSIVCGETGLWEGNNISCIPYSFVCPDGMDEFQTLPLQDGTHITFRLFYRTKVTYNDAVFLCTTHNASLLQVLTIAKHNFTQQLLQCPDYKKNIFIDGKYSVSKGFWETSDGQPLPTSEQFWKSGQIDGPLGDNRCVVFKRIHRNFTNYKCTDDKSYICEKH